MIENILIILLIGLGLGVISILPVLIYASFFYGILDREFKRKDLVKVIALFLTNYGVCIFHICSKEFKMFQAFYFSSQADDVRVILSLAFGIILYQLVKPLVAFAAHIIMWQRFKEENESFGHFLERIVPKKCFKPCDKEV